MLIAAAIFYDPYVLTHRTTKFNDSKPDALALNLSPSPFEPTENVRVQTSKKQERQPVLFVVDIYEYGCSEKSIRTLPASTWNHPGRNRHPSILFILFFSGVRNPLWLASRSIWS